MASTSRRLQRPTRFHGAEPWCRLQFEIWPLGSHGAQEPFATPAPPPVPLFEELKTSSSLVAIAPPFVRRCELLILNDLLRSPSTSFGPHRPPMVRNPHQHLFDSLRLDFYHKLRCSARVQIHPAGRGKLPLQYSHRPRPTAGPRARPRANSAMSSSAADSSNRL